MRSSPLTTAEEKKKEKRKRGQYTGLEENLMKDTCHRLSTQTKDASRPETHEVIRWKHEKKKKKIAQVCKRKRISTDVQENSVLFFCFQFSKGNIIKKKRRKIDSRASLRMTSEEATRRSTVSWVRVTVSWRSRLTGARAAASAYSRFDRLALSGEEMPDGG